MSNSHNEQLVSSIEMLDNAKQMLVTSFLEEKTSRINACMVKFTDQIRQNVEDYESLKETITEVAGYEEKHVVNAEQKGLVEDLNHQLKELQIRKEEVMREAEENKENVGNFDALNSKKSQEIALKEKSVGTTMDKFQKGVEFFESNLGLRFENMEDELLKLAFTCICDERPGDEFVVVMKVVERVYEVRECRPQVPDIDRMLDELNETNNFCKFLCQLRKQFKSIAAAS